MEHLPFLQPAVPAFSHPNPMSPFCWGFSSAHFSQGCPSPGLLLPHDLGSRPAPSVNDMELIISIAAPGYCLQPFTLLSGPPQVQPSRRYEENSAGMGRSRDVGVCLTAPCDSGACTTSTDTTERSRGESRVNSSHSRFAPCRRPAGSIHPV